MACSSCKLYTLPASMPKSCNSQTKTHSSRVLSMALLRLEFSRKSCLSVFSLHATKCYHACLEPMNGLVLLLAGKLWAKFRQVCNHDAMLHKEQQALPWWMLIDSRYAGTNACVKHACVPLLPAMGVKEQLMVNGRSSKRCNTAV